MGFSRFKNKIYNIYFYVFRNIICIFLFICIYISTISCNVEKVNTIIDTVIIRDTLIVVDTLYKKIEVIEKQKDKTVEEKILEICNALDGKLETEFNYGKEVNEIITFSKLPLKSAYCGAFVYYALTKAGINYDVKNPDWASNNFVDKTKIIWQKGKGVSEDRNIKIGYVTGYNFNSNRINHVGLYINDLSTHFKAFEGNTTDPSGKKQQGFFYKKRNKNITYIRKY